MTQNHALQPPAPVKKSHPCHKVDADEAGMRIDRWLKKKYPALTNGQIQKFLRTGQIRLDGKRVDGADRLEKGKEIRLPPLLNRDSGFLERAAQNQKSIQTPAKVDWLKKMILFEDNDLVVLNKPAGLAVQGGTGIKQNLDDQLMAFSTDGKTKPKLVHRLDRETSGVLVVAKNDFAARKLTEAFRERETQKIYWAITVQAPTPDHGIIDAPLVRMGEIMRVADKKEKGEDIKKAMTRYSVVEKAHKQAALVILKPITGRTHQLRAHLAHKGAPILGDRLYGGLPGETLPANEIGSGLHLHARRLIIPHPRKGRIDVTAPVDKEMKKTWNWFNFMSESEADRLIEED